MREMWDQWKSMDNQAKAPYETKAAEDLDRYRREVGYRTKSF